MFYEKPNGPQTLVFSSIVSQRVGNLFFQPKKYPKNTNPDEPKLFTNIIVVIIKIIFKKYMREIKNQLTNVFKILKNIFMKNRAICLSFGMLVEDSG